MDALKGIGAAAGMDHLRKDPFCEPSVSGCSLAVEPHGEKYASLSRHNLGIKKGGLFWLV